MPINRWIGGSNAIAQVTRSLFGGAPWVGSDTVTVTVGSKSFTVVVSSTVISAITVNVATALAALSVTAFPEFAAIVWSADATHLIGTGLNPGVPFAFSIATNSGSGTVGTPADLTANQGPNSWATAQNWSLTAVPVSTDDVVIDDPTYAILYDLDQHTVTLNSLTVPAKFSGSDQFGNVAGIGLPFTNQTGTAYPEYLPTYLRIGVNPGIALIGNGVGNGSGRLKIDFGSVAALVNVHGTGTSPDGNFAVMLLGTNAVNVLGNSEVGIATVPGQLSNVSGGLTLAANARVTCGAGVTLAAITNDGGTLEVNGAIGTSLTQQGGTTAIYGTGAVALLKLTNGAYVSYCTSGVLGGNCTLDGVSILDFGGDQQQKTHTNVIVARGGSQVLDPLNVVTGGSNLRISSPDGTALFNLGPSWTVTRS
jgi:hypothetical protein